MSSIFLGVLLLAQPTPDADALSRTITLTVTDAKGGPVSGLAREDVALLENGVARDVVSFTLDRRPLTVAFLLDTSAGHRTRVPPARGPGRHGLSHGPPRGLAVRPLDGGRAAAEAGGLHRRRQGRRPGPEASGSRRGQHPPGRPPGGDEGPPEEGRGAQRGGGGERDGSRVQQHLPRAGGGERAVARHHLPLRPPRGRHDRCENRTNYDFVLDGLAKKSGGLSTHHPLTPWAWTGS